MIKEKLSIAIRSLSKRHNIQEKEVRIKISKTDKSLKYEVMKNADVLEETNIATALNLNTVVSFMVGNKLNIIVDSLVKEYNIHPDNINVRIYTKSEDCSPLLYLFDGVTPKKALDIDEFI